MTIYILDWKKIWKDCNKLIDICEPYDGDGVSWSQNKCFIQFMVEQQLRDHNITSRRVISYIAWRNLFRDFDEWYLRPRKGKVVWNRTYHWTRKKEKLRNLIEALLIKKGIKPKKKVLSPIKKVFNREESIILDE